MEALYRYVDEVITARAGELTAIADAIWDHPETRFEEFWSAERLALALEAEGFEVCREAGGIPNAFVASYGSGKPVIALLGEYDALAGLSQQAQCAYPAAAMPGANGHGCGHNLLGTSQLRRHCLPELAGAARRLRDDSFLRLSGGRRRFRQNVYGARRHV